MIVQVILRHILMLGTMIVMQVLKDGHQHMTIITQVQVLIMGVLLIPIQIPSAMIIMTMVLSHTIVMYICQYNTLIRILLQSHTGV